MTKENHAMLDTDFLSKTCAICAGEQNRLIDRILELPHYYFYCHAQIQTELQSRDSAAEWLWARSRENRIQIWSDERILTELSAIYGASAVAMYVQLLKNACDPYGNGYFTEKFAHTAKTDVLEITADVFLKCLEQDEHLIGKKQNLGEIKTYVLLQMLYLKLGQQIYVFCSDDKDARKGIISIGEVQCISVLSSFLRLRKELEFSRAEAEPYIQSYLKLCEQQGQMTFRIQEASKERRMCKVPCRQVFDEMYQDRLEELKTGDLGYLPKN